MMKTRHLYSGRVFFPVFLTATGLLLFSCTQFFSTSWAPWAAREYDKLIPAVTADNVDQLTSIYENDPDGSLALLKKIQESQESSDESSPVLEAAALKAAVNSIGLVSAIAGVAGDLSGWDDSTDFKGIFENALNGMKNLEDASAALFEILPGIDDPGFDDFIAFASADDLAMGAVVLLLGEVSANVDFDDPDAFNDFLESLPDNQNIQLAKALVEASIAKGDELSGPLRDILDNLNLS
jgi:hypothetical protein